MNSLSLSRSSSTGFVLDWVYSNYSRSSTKAGILVCFAYCSIFISFFLLFFLQEKITTLNTYTCTGALCPWESQRLTCMRGSYCSTITAPSTQWALSVYLVNQRKNRAVIDTKSVELCFFTLLTSQVLSTLYSWNLLFFKSVSKYSLNIGLCTCQTLSWFRPNVCNR